MSKQTADNIRTTVQFKPATTKSGKRAFEAWCAVWTHDGLDVFVGAPTLDLLAASWRLLPGVVSELNRRQAQHVWIVKVEEKKDGQG